MDYTTRPRHAVTGLITATSIAMLTASLTVKPAFADPCGMVPPVYITGKVPIERIGLQKTYVFYRDGVETFVIRPGFQGRADEFGILIPFPDPPALRKVADDIFAHVAAAIDPPEVVVDLRPIYEIRVFANSAGRRGASDELAERELAYDEVRVVNQEAIGMYEVAVLEAGSSTALNRWMTEHGYRYPDGMDDVCNEYIEDRWCFVAVKARVGQKAGVDPRPGMKEVDSALPADSTFDGHVQAMGFRFRSDELVVPMRLSAFNEGELHNVVYVLTTEPVRIDSIPQEYVVRQITGSDLWKHVTEPLPLRVIGGEESDIPEPRRRRLKEERNPEPHNGIARDLFAADLLAATSGELAHEYEETEKKLLEISERLGIRGPEVDKLHRQVVQEQRKRVVARALSLLHTMTLTVIDGDFPRNVIARENLRFSPFQVAALDNTPEVYHAGAFGPSPEDSAFSGIRVRDSINGGTVIVEKRPVASATLRRVIVWSLFALPLAVSVMVIRRSSHRRMKEKALASLAAMALILPAVQMAAHAGVGDDASARISQLFDQLVAGSDVDATIEVLLQNREVAVQVAATTARRHEDMVRRGWAILVLSRINDDPSILILEALAKDPGQSALIRSWAAAGRLSSTTSIDELLSIAPLVHELPALTKPLTDQVRRLIAAIDGNQTEVMLELMTSVPVLRNELSEAVLTINPEALAGVMLGASNVNVRREAAAWLATMARENQLAVANAVIAGNTFVAEKHQAPWDDGALFIPSINWSRSQAQRLINELTAWYISSDVYGVPADSAPIINNFMSVGLIRTAGAEPPGARDLDSWLIAWGRAVGAVELRTLFERTGVSRHRRFREILTRLDR